MSPGDTHSIHSPSVTNALWTWALYLCLKSGYKLPQSQLLKNSILRGRQADCDGKLYFTSEKQGLWQMNPDGRSASVVQGLEQKRFGRMWTVTANRIYFIDIDSDRRASQRYDLNTHQISLVGVLPSEALIGYPSLSVSSVDGSVLFSGKENVRSNLMIFRRSGTDQTK